MTGQAGKVGRGLRSIGANIAKLATDAGELTYTVNGVTKSISLFDETTGDMKNTYQVLSEISEDWDKMSKAEQSTLAIAQAGKTQIDVYTSVMSNFETAIDATNTSINSQGSAMEENSKYMESMGAKLNALKAQFQELVLGDGGLNTFLKGLIDLGTAILKFANTDIGMATIALTGFGLVLLNIKTIIPNLIAGLVGLDTAEMASIVATNGLSGAFDTLTASILANPFGLVLTGITALSAGLVYLAMKTKESVDNDKTMEDSLNKLHNSGMKFKEDVDKQKESISSLSSELTTISSKISELSSKDSLKIAEQQQLDLLQQQEKSLENQLAIEQEQLRLKQQKASKSASKALKETVEWVDGSADSAGEVSQITRYEALEKTQNKVKSLKKDYSELETELAKMADANETDTKAYKKKSKQLDELEKRIDSQKDIMKDLATNLSEEASQLDLTNDKNKKLYNIVQGVIDSYNEFLGVSSKVLNSNDEVEESTDNSTDALEAYQSSLEELSNMGGAFDTLNDSISEYNENGQFSFETLEKVLSLGEEYVNLLQVQNGKMSLNNDAVTTLIESKKNEAIANAINATSKQLDTIAEESNSRALEENAKVTINSAEDWKNYKATIDSATTSLAYNTDELLKNVEAKGNSITLDETGKKQSEKAIANLKKQIEFIKNSSFSIEKKTSSTKKATKSTKKNTEEIDKNIEALKKQKNAIDKIVDSLKDEVDNYKDVISYITEKLEGKIEELENLRDKELDAIETQKGSIEEVYDYEISKIKEKKDALEKYHDIEISQIEEEIGSLEKLKDESEDYYNSKIDEIKETNDELDDQLQLQEKIEALAKAKSKKVKIIKNGQISYVEDESSVSKAQEELETLKAKQKSDNAIKLLEQERDKQSNIYQQQIDSLKLREENLNKIYETQVEDLENQSDSLTSQYNKQVEELDSQSKKISELYDEQISYYENYKDKFTNMVNTYENEQNRLLALQLTGIDFEKNGWEKRLDNLNNFVSKYTNKLSELEKAQLKQSNISDALEDAQNESSTSSTSSKSSSKSKNNYKSSKSKNNYKNTFSSMGSISVYASGSSNIQEDEIGIVGDTPNKELVIGSKLNGSLIKLSKGTGVVNAKSTNTLSGILNNLSGLKGIGENISNTNKSIINNFNITANVQDGQGLVDYLQNFSTSMTQKAYT